MSYHELFKLGKFVIFIIAVFLFICNSTVIFQHFIARKKVTSSEDIPNEALVPPAIFVCRELAFTAEMAPMVKLEDFLNNTLNLNYSMYIKGNDILMLVSNNGVKKNPTIQIGRNPTIANAPRSLYESYFRIEYVYSFSRGLCYKFLFLSKLKPYDVVGLTIHPLHGQNNEDLNIYITEPGEEYFVHMYFWRIDPFSFKLDSQTELIDLPVKKILSYREGNCNDTEDYDYIKCVKSEYRKHSKAGREHKTEINVITTYPNCTMPWRQSMLDEHWSTIYNQEDVSTCNDSEIKALYLLDYQFLKDAAGLNIKNCAEPCKTTTYQSNALQMKQMPSNIWHQESKSNKTSFTRLIRMYYTTSDVTTTTESQLIDFSGLISAVGGNLGLFLGFSFLGILINLLDITESLFLSKKKKFNKQ